LYNDGVTMFAWMASEKNLSYIQTKSRCKNIFRR
jgi:hypothetical protein